MVETHANSTENGTDYTSLADHPKNALYWFNFIIALLVIIVGGPGNLLTIVAIVFKKELRTAFNLLIAVIAVADALTILVAVPLHFDAILTRLPHSIPLCQLEVFISSISFNMSVFLIPSIASIRLYAVRSGVFFKLKWSVAVTIVAIFTIFSVVIASSIAFVSPSLLRLACLDINRITNETMENYAGGMNKVNLSLIFGLTMVALCYLHSNGKIYQNESANSSSS